MNLPYGTRWTFIFEDSNAMAFLKNKTGSILVQVIASESDGIDYQSEGYFSFYNIENPREFVWEWVDKYFD